MSTPKERLQAVMPLIKQALEMVPPTMIPGVAVIGTKEDTSGKVVCRFDVSFFHDLAELLEVKDNPGWFTKDDLGEPIPPTQKNDN